MAPKMIASLITSVIFIFWLVFFSPLKSLKSDFQALRSDFQALRCELSDFSFLLELIALLPNVYFPHLVVVSCRRRSCTWSAFSLKILFWEALVTFSYLKGGEESKWSLSGSKVGRRRRGEGGDRRSGGTHFMALTVGG